ncbi:leucyl aminopeptidase family protein [Marinivivus vitaminiproducens]|uniref:leucyl aminopeptidase family protein n=1 Tax=Marinivivus vitaminiproducens TaxID=3035935 RepID=UPI00279CD9B1|nr:leucyl aminopeptidase family protein [Geminicoccaceae bacterium SCSIO 64248]
MLPCFVTDPGNDARPVHAVALSAYATWLAAQEPRRRAWLEGGVFEAKPGAVALLPGADGAPDAALLITGDASDPFDAARLPPALPAGTWRLEPGGSLAPADAVLGWAMAAYRFERYKEIPARGVSLAAGNGAAIDRAHALARSIWLARDLINTPANDLGPAELEDAALGVAERFDASFSCITGDDLLAQNYPAIHAVGKGSSRAPRLIDLTWGDASAPKLTLVGKGVCFDTGGLDIKPSSNMLLMKKDMGGAAVMLALAQAIMTRNWPVRLRLLLPAVENAISGNAFRPSDIIATRKGLSVEIGNTDAEGRLILADALAEADREKPDVLIDAATLTGAARVALGPDLPALFSPSDELADAIATAGDDAHDPLWRLPLHPGYRAMLDCDVADLSNTGTGGFAGAITAALFLKAFVTDTPSWAHLDIYGWNPSARPGRPKGGEATALRALFTALERRFTA